VTGIETIANQLGVSVSESLEQVGCGSLAIVDAEELEDYLDLQDALAAEAALENCDRVPWEQVKQDLGL